MARLPSISVIMPVRNEATFIEQSLGAMLAQDYPPDLCEILVIDGMSTDGTRERIETLTHDSKTNVRILDNPQKTVPPAMNIGIRAATADIVARMDGHTKASPDYLRRCVETLQQTGADNVGGVVRFVGKDAFSRAAGLAAQSKFGCGGAPARSAQEGFVDTVSFGCWRREAFERFGVFDEQFVRTQDSEFNYRTRLLGGKIWMNPDIVTEYYNRASPTTLMKQYFQYGFWKTRLMHKLRAMRREQGLPSGLRSKAKLAVGRLHARHIIPPLFVLGLIVSAAILLTRLLTRGSNFWLAAGLAVPAGYALSCVAASILVAQRQRAWRLFPLLLVIFPILHLSWGTGFLWGYLRKPAKQPFKGELHADRRASG